MRITLHTAGLLAVGGRMVYSTCSFNPVEDEAVVAEVRINFINAFTPPRNTSSKMPQILDSRTCFFCRGLLNAKFAVFNTLEDVCLVWQDQERRKDLLARYRIAGTYHLFFTFSLDWGLYGALAKYGTKSQVAENDDNILIGRF